MLTLLDHNTLLQRLRKSYGLGGKVIDWFTSYLSNRKQQVRTMTSSLVPSAGFFECHKARSLDRSCFSFTLPTCCNSLNVIISRLTRMQSADTQIYGHCQPSDACSLIQQVSVCIDEVSALMKANRLQLNPAKTEVLWCASSRRHHQIPTDPVYVRRCWFGVASHYYPRSSCIHRRRRRHEDPCHQHRQSVFCSTAPDP